MRCAYSRSSRTSRTGRPLTSEKHLLWHFVALYTDLRHLFLAPCMWTLRRLLHLILSIDVTSPNRTPCDGECDQFLRCCDNVQQLRLTQSYVLIPGILGFRPSNTSIFRNLLPMRRGHLLLYRFHAMNSAPRSSSSSSCAAVSQKRLSFIYR